MRKSSDFAVMLDHRSVIDDYAIANPCESGYHRSRAYRNPSANLRRRAYNGRRVKHACRRKALSLKFAEEPLPQDWFAHGRNEVPVRRLCIDFGFTLNTSAKGKSPVGGCVGIYHQQLRKPAGQRSRLGNDPAVTAAADDEKAGQGAVPHCLQGNGTITGR